MLESYLTALREELSKRLPEEDVAARLAEIDAHLREDIEGRLELGLELDQAQREAIESFGKSRRIAQELVPRPSPRARVDLLAFGYGIGVLLVVRPLPAIWEWRWFIPMVFACWVLVGLAFGLAAYRARRPASLRIAVMGIVGALAVWLASATWVDLGLRYGRTPVASLGREAELQQREIESREAHREEFAARLREFESRGVAAFKRSGAYWAPVARARWGRFETLEYGYYDDPHRAEHAWRAAGKGAWSAFDTSEYRALRQAFQNPTLDPMGSLKEFAPVILPPCLGVAALAVGIDLGFSGLGAFAFALRRRAKGGGLRA